LEVGEPHPYINYDNAELADQTEIAYIKSQISAMPPIAREPGVKAFVIFLASVKVDGASAYKEDTEALASQQAARFKSAD
jgi:hypothetical protein